MEFGGKTKSRLDELQLAKEKRLCGRWIISTVQALRQLRASLAQLNANIWPCVSGLCSSTYECSGMTGVTSRPAQHADVVVGVVVVCMHTLFRVGVPEGKDARQASKHRLHLCSLRPAVNVTTDPVHMGPSYTCVCVPRIL
jgi:hypothetical protein